MKCPVLTRPCALFLFLLLPLASSTLQAQALTLREMVASSGRIFVGTVAQTRGGVDSRGDIVTRTTFRVEQMLHGQPASTITIMQFGGEARGLSTRIPHMRYFTQGEHLVVMLYPESELGFTSPIGMGQGVWQVTKNGDVVGLTPAMLEGLGPVLKKNGISSPTARSMTLPRFQSVVREIAKQRGTR